MLEQWPIVVVADSPAGCGGGARRKIVGGSSPWHRNSLKTYQ